MLGMFRPTLIAALLASGPLLLLAYLALGAVALPIGELLSVIKYALLGDLDSARELFPRTSAILLHIRLPRALAGPVLHMFSVAYIGNPCSSLSRLVYKVTRWSIAIELQSFRRPADPPSNLDLILWSCDLGPLTLNLLPMNGNGQREYNLLLWFYSLL